MILSGEKIQQMCDIYLGTEYDFNYNPLIQKDTSKHTSIVFPQGQLPQFETV